MAKVKPVLLTKRRCDELCEKAFRQYVINSIVTKSVHDATDLQSSDNVRLDVYPSSSGKDCDVDEDIVDVHSQNK